MREQQTSKLVVTDRKRRESKQNQVRARQVVTQETAAEVCRERKKCAKEVAHLFNAQRHQQLHAKLVKANLSSLLSTPKNIPCPTTGFDFATLLQTRHHCLGDSRRVTNAIHHRVTGCRVHHTRSRAVRNGTLRRDWWSTTERDPARLDFDNVLFDNVHSHASHASVESALELVKRHLDASDEARLLNKDDILVHREHVEERRHAPQSLLLLCFANLGIALAEIHKDGFVHREAVIRNAHFDAVRRLPARRRSLLVAQHLSVVTGTGDDEARIERERDCLLRTFLFNELRFLRLGSVVDQRASHFCELILTRVAVAHEIHQTWHVLDASRRTLVQQVVSQSLTAHLSVRTSERVTSSRIRVIKPYERVFILVKQAVLEAELLELIQPHAIVVHKRSVGRNQSN